MHKLSLLAIALIGLGLNASVTAATITWVGPSNITNVTADLATTGSVYKDALYAQNSGADVLLGADTVFHHQIVATAGDYSTNDIRVQTNISNNGVTGTPPSTLFPTYGTVLNGLDYGLGLPTNDATNGTITLRNLTIGQGYQVQIWTVQRDGNGYVTTYTAGNSVSLNLDPDGQFAVGTFTADALTEAIKFKTASAGANYYTVNAVALRSVPEPASLGILGVGMAGLGLMRRRTRAARFAILSRGSRKMLQTTAVAAIVAFTFFGVTSTYGGVIVTNADGELRNSDFGGTIGFKFTVGNTALTVTDLGAYDYGSPGFTYQAQTGLWNAGGTLIASVTFVGGNVTTGTTLIDNYRYQSIAPVTLAPNATYSLGTYYEYQGAAGDYWLGNTVLGSGDAYSPLITMNGAAYAGPVFQFPGGNGGGNQSFDGPNAIFAVPEPATLGVLGMLPILAWRRRR